jgi:hypothetical protein
MPVLVASELLVMQAPHYAVGWGTLGLINAGIAQRRAGAA